ncbi:hypothetical protein BC828DRAFT_375120 [Blastocladiella britannica]|nr:hypothetical protein BC828DRAFT_375120 [Blastocladiella britannica]
MSNPQNLQTISNNSSGNTFQQLIGYHATELHTRTASIKLPGLQSTFFLSMDTTPAAAHQGSFSPMLVAVAFDKAMANWAFTQCKITIVFGSTNLDCQIDLSSFRHGACGVSQLVHGLQRPSAYGSGVTVKATVEFINGPFAAPIATSMPHMLVPSALGLLESLDCTTLCDCSFLPNGATEAIYASKALVARASPFFKTIFNSPSSSGKFAEAKAIKENKPMDMSAWRTPAFVLMLVHVYSGWLPGAPLPKLAEEGVVAKFKCTPADLEYADWRNLYELARMLELHQFAAAANKQLVNLLLAEHEAITGKLGGARIEE